LDMPHFVLSVTNPPRLETMSDFFTARAPIYDEYMLYNVEGVAEGYTEFAKHIPSKTETLLDLGCGTGLELSEIFRRYPDIQVTGIDLTQAMLDRLSEKYSNRQITLICASYLGYDFGFEKYDCAISFETMHHLTPDEKLALYTSIHKALKPYGRYLEGDYMVDTQAEEDHFIAEREEFRSGQINRDGEIYHVDTPSTVENQIKLFLAAGFSDAKRVWHKGNTTIIVGEK